MGADSHQTVSEANAKPALDDLMLAMDIVDTLRHDMRIAERELGDDARREALKQRLREIYSSQGISVPDNMLEEGVRALEQDRFTYKSQASGFSAGLARAYVNRGVWARRIGLVLLLGLLGWGGWYLAVERPRAVREAAVVAELSKGAADLDVLSGEIASLTNSTEIRQRASAIATEGRNAAATADTAGLREAVEALGAIRTEVAELAALPARIGGLVASAKAEAKDQAGLSLVTNLEVRGRKAVENADLTAAREAASELTALLTRLRQSYEIRIVQQQGTPSGVWRIPDVNQEARNYYIIVEAVGPDGQTIAMNILNEETKKTANAARWGIRVPKNLFDAVRRDKTDDGIIQNAKVAEKPRGAVDPVWVIPAPGGTITEW
jgi:hypothetical protein